MSGLTADFGADAGETVLNADDICLEEATTDRAVRVQELAVGDEIRIPVFKEELTATVQATEVGSVRIAKRIISEDQVLDVPVTDEEIRVERRIVERPIDGLGSQSIEQIIIEIPIRKEMVDVEKQTHVAEEIIVTKEIIQRPERVTDTIRREEVRIDEGDGVGRE